MNFKKEAFLFLLLFLTACSGNTNNSLEIALQKAGKNRKELEKVLNYYSQQEDSLKYEAAVFLISNMPYHYSIQPECVQKLQPVYEEYSELSASYGWERSAEWARKTDSLERVKRTEFPGLSNETIQRDIQHVKADWLIHYIDLSFNAWLTNPYTRNLSFTSFCKHVLPYRFINGSEIDDAKEYFYERLSSFFDGSLGSFMNATDSALYTMRDLKNNTSYGTRLSEVYNYKDIEKIRYIQCNDKCWYNALALSAAGMAVTIDKVPAWGNRNNSHSWNALIIDEESWPFEPFWDEDRWKYKEIYNNHQSDKVWGKLRLPKVFRRSYTPIQEGPAPDRSIDRIHIPPFFRDILLEDVSQDYFETCDITISIPDSIKKLPKYGYIAVFNNRRWEPVHWGEISKRNIRFKNMGKDMVYIIGLYESNLFHPVTHPFYLSGDGEIQYIKIEQEKQSITLQSLGHYITMGERNRAIRSLDGAIWNINTGLENIPMDTMNLDMDISENIVLLKEPVKSRYIYLQLPTDTFALSELTVYTLLNGEHIPIKDIKITTGLTPISHQEKSEMIYDGLSGTGFFGKITTPGKTIIEFDLGHEYWVSGLEYVPYVFTVFQPGNRYTVYYWENGWKPFSFSEGSGFPIVLEGIPKGTLYRIETEQQRAQRNIERIFTYNNGKILWW